MGRIGRIPCKLCSFRQMQPDRKLQTSSIFKIFLSSAGLFVVLDHKWISAAAIASHDLREYYLLTDNSLSRGIDPERNNIVNQEPDSIFFLDATHRHSCSTMLSSIQDT